MKHWSMVEQREQIGVSEDPRRQVLEFLIVSHWLVGEASRQGHAATQAEVSRRLEATRSVLFAGAEANYTKKLAASGRNAADLRFEVETEIAYNHLHEAVIKGASAVSPAEVRAYYRANPGQFHRAERRYFDTDNLSSDKAARRVRAEVEAGADLRSISLHEYADRATAFREPGKVKIERAIFSAKLGELKGPIVIEPFKLHSIFIVRRIEPAGLMTLGEARGKIERLLRHRKQQQALASFEDGWRKRWSAITDCARGFIVPGCKQIPTANTSPGRFAFATTGLWAAERPSLPG